MYTKRALFCTGPDVNFDFFTSHQQKVDINNKRGNRVTENKPRFWPDQKKTDPMTRFASSFSAGPRSDPITIFNQKLGKS